MKPARFHPDALAEHDEGLAHYAQVDDELARRFRLAVLEARERVQATPKLYAEDDDTGCRTAPVHGFPYALHYLEFDEFVWVIAVAHHRRRPGYWQGRLR